MYVCMYVSTVLFVWLLTVYSVSCCIILYYIMQYYCLLYVCMCQLNCSYEGSSNEVRFSILRKYTSFFDIIKIKSVRESELCVTVFIPSRIWVRGSPKVFPEVLAISAEKIKLESSSWVPCDKPHMWWYDLSRLPLPSHLIWVEENIVLPPRGVPGMIMFPRMPSNYSI